MGAVGREEQQFESVGAFLEERLEQLGVVVAGVVEHDDDPAARRAAAEQQAKELLELDGVEDRREGVGELAGAQGHRAEAGDRLSGGRVPEHGIPVLGRDPHAAAAAVALEVALVLAPQVNVVSARQHAEFF